MGEGLLQQVAPLKLILQDGLQPCAVGVYKGFWGMQSLQPTSTQATAQLSGMTDS